MGRIQKVVAWLLAAIAVVIGGGSGAAAAGFTIEGRVYCDACRAGFETTASQNLGGAKVKVECRHYESEEIVNKAEGVTDATGRYRIKIVEDHQEDICEVVLLQSPSSECGEIEQFRDRSRVPLTRNNGIVQGGVRFANPIAFFRKEPLTNCGILLRKYSLGDDSSENP